MAGADPIATKPLPETWISTQFPKVKLSSRLDQLKKKIDFRVFYQANPSKPHGPYAGKVAGTLSNKNIKLGYFKDKVQDTLKLPISEYAAGDKQLEYTKETFAHEWQVAEEILGALVEFCDEFGVKRYDEELVGAKKTKIPRQPKFFNVTKEKTVTEGKYAGRTFRNFAISVNTKFIEAKVGVTIDPLDIPITSSMKIDGINYTGKTRREVVDKLQHGQYFVQASGLYSAKFNATKGEVYVSWKDTAFTINTNMQKPSYDVEEAMAGHDAMAESFDFKGADPEMLTVKEPESELSKKEGETDADFLVRLAVRERSKADASDEATFGD